MYRNSHFDLTWLWHISTFQTDSHENASQPSNQAVCKCKRNTAKCQGSDQRLAIAVKGVSYNANTCCRQSTETESLGFAQTHCAFLWRVGMIAEILLSGIFMSKRTKYVLASGTTSAHKGWSMYSTKTKIGTGGFPPKWVQLILQRGCKNCQ